jgi:predicted adenylyl cyclase CyaB
MIEREVKIRVTSHDALRPLLQAMGATPAGSEEEINRILDSQDGSLQRSSQVLRVRTANKNTLTWKGPVAGQDPYGHKAREELEITFADDGADTMLALLARLGFAEVLRYEKHRETWRWQSVEIALDHLNFGDFVEIEGDAGAIQHALRLLRLDQEPLEMRSYAQLQREAQQAR